MGHGVSQKPESGPPPARFWLAQGAVLSPCPECGAPMSIRLWLMVADCWQCGASVEMTEADEQAIQDLLRATERDNRPPVSVPPPPTPPSPTPRSAPPARPIVPRNTSIAPPVSVSAVKPPEAAPAVLPAATAQRSLARRLARRSGPMPYARLLRQLLREFPAWMMSLLCHLAFLAMLAFLRRHTTDDGEPIVLSLSVARDHTTRDEAVILDPSHEQFDLPIPEEFDVENEHDREVLVRADQDARPLRLDADAELPQLPQLKQVQAIIRTGREDLRALATRDPRLRREILQHEGGTTLTEAAVARGLRYLAGQQRQNGSWRLAEGGKDSEPAATALALLPFLGAGQTDRVGIYQEHVSSGLNYLLQLQSPNGDIRGNVPEQYVMYTHGQATIVLCEAYAITRDARLREPAQRAVHRIVRAQYPCGGWRYLPRDETNDHQLLGDTSVVGWQLMALQSARAAGLEVPAATWDLADQFLDGVMDAEGARYSYQPGHAPTETMTAEALLCRMYLGWRREHPQMQTSVSYLLDEHPPNLRDPNVYYWYYATQALHHLGGESWDRWNRQMRDVLVETQETRGRHSGSWPPRGPHTDIGGRVYMTALAVCTLEVYYRHAPIFRQINLD